MDPPKRGALNQTIHVALSGADDANESVFIKPALRIGQNTCGLQLDGMKADSAAMFTVDRACGAG